MTPTVALMQDLAAINRADMQAAQHPATIRFLNKKIEIYEEQALVLKAAELERTHNCEVTVVREPDIRMVGLYWYQASAYRGLYRAAQTDWVSGPMLALEVLEQALGGI